MFHWMNWYLRSMSAASDDMALQFEAISGMPEEERRIIKALLDGMILKYQAKQITERS